MVLFTKLLTKAAIATSPALILSMVLFTKLLTITRDSFFRLMILSMVLFTKLLTTQLGMTQEERF